MIEKILMEALIYLSAGLFLFSYRGKIYQVTNVVFYFYVSVFSLSLLKSLADENSAYYGLFFEIHLAVLAILMVIIVIEFIRKMKKYIYVAPLLLGSILTMLWFLFYDCEHFLLVHHSTIIIDSILVTWFVFHKKNVAVKSTKIKYEMKEF